MSLANPIQTSFASGVLTPLMYGRVDIAKYSAGLAEGVNMFIYQQGPAFRRSGTRFIRPAHDSNYKSRLISFEFSTIQAYVLEFSQNVAKIFKEEALVPATTLTTNLPASILQEMDYDQSADTLYLTHVSYIPREITRTSDTSWTIANYNFLDGPYYPENTNTTVTITLTTNPSPGGSSTVTASSGIFTSTDASATFQRHFRLAYVAGSGDIRIIWGKISGYTSSTTVTVTWVGGNFTGFTEAAFNASSEKHRWRLGAFGETTGYPRYTRFFEERKVFASTLDQPDTVWFSKSQDLENFAPTEYDASVLEDNGIVVTLPSAKVNAITSIINLGQKVLVTTIGSSWEILSSDNNPLTPQTVVRKKVGEIGSRLGCSAVVANSSVFFLHRSGRTLYELAQSDSGGYSTDTYYPEETSILSEHLFRKGGAYATRIFFQQEPNPRLWILRSDGSLIVATYNRLQSVYAFSEVYIGGTDSVVESLALVPSADGTTETVYLSIQRTINGSSVRHIEFMEEDFQPNSSTDKSSMFFVDSGVTVTGSGLTTITGLSHLEGETVSVIADGSLVDSEAVVSGGQITIETPANSVVVGYAYPSYIVTLEPEAGASMGTAQGKIKRIDHVTVRLLSSLSFSYGPYNPTAPLDDLVIEDFRKDGDAPSVSPPFFTGDKRIALTMPYETNNQYIIAQTQPYPLTLLALMPELRTSK